MRTDRELLTQFTLATQKARSNILELGLPEGLLATTNPWLFGDQCILTAVEKLEEAPEDADLTSGIFNLLTVADLFEAAIGICALNYGPALPTGTEYMSERMG